MKAILPVRIKKDEKIIEKMKLFDTETAKKICEVTNSFGNVVEEIYLSPNGMLFLYDNRNKIIKTQDEEKIKRFIGENYPDEYEATFGKVEEA